MFTFLAQKFMKPKLTKALIREVLSEFSNDAYIKGVQSASSGDRATAPSVSILAIL